MLSLKAKTGAKTAEMSYINVKLNTKICIDTYETDTYIIPSKQIKTCFVCIYITRTRTHIYRSIDMTIGFWILAIFSKKC